MPLDEDDEHATYDAGAVTSYFAAATRAALVLAAFRAPYRGRSTPVNAWWGSFDLAVNLFSGHPPSRRRETSSCATRWTPRRSPSAGGRVILATGRLRSTPTPIQRLTASPTRPLARGSRWDDALGEYVLDWDDVCSSPDPHAAALEFARSAFRHACTVCEWDPALLASAEGSPPPVS